MSPLTVSELERLLDVREVENFRARITKRDKMVLAASSRGSQHYGYRRNGETLNQVPVYRCFTPGKLNHWALSK